MKIPSVDLKAQYRNIASEVNSSIAEVIGDSAFVGGKYVQEFEAKFAAFCGGRHCIGVGSGTDALFIALKTIGIGPGEEVIVPANTFIATAEAVTMAGARAVFVDCDVKSYTIDVNKIADKISSLTKAIIPVHLYGHPVDMPNVQKIARDFGLKIIQDCAQAHGAEIDGKSLIDFGDILCFSFYPGKNLGAYGDAGAIVTNNGRLAQKIRMFANHGRKGKHSHEFEGINSRMDGMQGAVLNIKLKYLPEWIDLRRKVAALYGDALEGVGDIKLPFCLPKYKHVYHLYVIRTKKRDALRGHLKSNGIDIGIHYPVALPNLKAYQYLGHLPGDFPVASLYQNEILSLPIYPELSSDMIHYVARAIEDFFDLFP
jgi:dTDP-4-amino-4,6-dideoxygalactose transaminase